MTVGSKTAVKIAQRVIGGAAEDEILAATLVTAKGGFVRQLARGGFGVGGAAGAAVVRSAIKLYAAATDGSGQLPRLMLFALTEGTLHVFEVKSQRKQVPFMEIPTTAYSIGDVRKRAVTVQFALVLDDGTSLQLEAKRLVANRHNPDAVEAFRAAGTAHLEAAETSASR